MHHLGCILVTSLTNIYFPHHHADWQGFSFFTWARPLPPTVVLPPEKAEGCEGYLQYLHAEDGEREAARDGSKSNGKKRISLNVSARASQCRRAEVSFSIDCVIEVSSCGGGHHVHYLEVRVTLEPFKLCILSQWDSLPSCLSGTKHKTYDLAWSVRFEHLEQRKKESKIIIQFHIDIKKNAFLKWKAKKEVRLVSVFHQAVGVSTRRCILRQCLCLQHLLMRTVCWKINLALIKEKFSINVCNSRFSCTPSEFYCESQVNKLRKRIWMRFAITIELSMNLSDPRTVAPSSE